MANCQLLRRGESTGKQKFPGDRMAKNFQHGVSDIHLYIEEAHWT